MIKVGIAAFAFSLILNAVIAIIFSLFAPEYDKASAFWAVFLFLAVGPIVFGIVGGLQGWISYGLFTRHLYKKAFLKELRSAGYPDPKGEYDASAYFLSAATNGDLSRQVQMKAMQAWAQIEAEKRHHTYSSGAMMVISASAALEEYDKRFEPLRPAKDKWEEE